MKGKISGSITDLKLQIFSALVLLILFWVSTSSATESDVQEQSERSGRSWHQSLFGPQMLMQHQQNQPSVSTSQPDGPNQQPNQPPPQTSDLNVPNRNFEEHEKSALPAASEQDFMSRHFGYLNVHRFDPNFPYYDSRNSFPRYPSPHAPRFGPGYRKDKYGHGYGYSCKQGDDCEEVKAANQLAARNPAPAPSPYSPHPFHHNPMTPFGNQFPDLAPFPSMPSFPNMNSFAGAYGNQFGAPPPARFSDPHPQPPPPPPMHQSLLPPRYYHGRYLHDQEDKTKESASNPSPKESKSSSK